MRHARTFGVSFIALLALTASAHASDCGEKDNAVSVAEHIFEKSDTNEDGRLIPVEFADADLARYGVPFEEFDANEDGAISLDEYLDLFERHHPPTEVI